MGEGAALVRSRVEYVEHLKEHQGRKGHRLREAEVAYVRRKGLVPGDEALVMQDPAGNWVELTETRLVM